MKRSLLPASRGGKFGLAAALGLLSSMVSLWLAWFVSLPPFTWFIRPGFKAVESVCNACGPSFGTSFAVVINAALFGLAWLALLAILDRLLLETSHRHG